MHDLLLFTPDNKSCKGRLEDFMKVLLKTGVKLSPKMCQLVMKEFQYMCYSIFITGKKVCVRPVTMGIEVIHRLKLPTALSDAEVLLE